MEGKESTGVSTPLFTFFWQGVVMMRTQPDIHRQHIETWQQQKTQWQ